MGLRMKQSYTSLLVLLLVIQVALGNEAKQKDCKPLNVNGIKGNVVCVCDEDYCDEIRVKWPERSGDSILISSTKAGHRMSVLNTSFDESWFDLVSKGVQLDVDTSVRFQHIMGWGGAFTDATGINLKSLSKSMADKLLEGYYGEHGLQYNFGRVPIGGSDFSARQYSYDDTSEVDLELKNWQLATEDTEYKIPYLQQAAELVKTRGSNLKLFASPWSPPKWMKTNNSTVKGFLIDEDLYYKSYANYIIKFYDAYRKHGVKFWGGTVQNEPLSSYLYHYFFSSMQMESQQMKKFIGQYLGPALVARNFTRDNFKLMVGDDNLGLINTHVQDLMDDPEVSKYVSGLAYHWYGSGTIVPHQVLNDLYEHIKDKVEFVMMSEACTGWEFHDRGVILGDWSRGERYAYDIIEDLRHHTSSWIDWNMALGVDGGPNWARNFVDSPVIVNSEKNEFYRQPMYYMLAHFSRFFQPGSVRVKAELVNTPDNGNLNTVAVLNKETGHLIVNILNRLPHSKLINVRDLNEVGVRAGHLTPFVVAPSSMSTLLIKL